MGRTRLALTALMAAGLLTTAIPAANAAAPVPPRIDLKVLVLDDGGSAVGAIVAELKNTGVPYQTVALGAAGRPTVNAAFLSDTVGGRPRAKFQGVVTPNEIPFGSAAAPEQAALAAYEKTFGIRQIDAYTWAHPEVGLDYTDQNGGWSGVLDGAKTQVTPAGKAGPFGYLNGTVTFEDNDPSIPESYGYAAHPRAGFTSYLNAPTGGSLLGEYAHDGRDELVVTFAYNQYQEQFQVLAKGMVEWLTQGVHLGQSRNYFSVHVDDMFAPDSRWDPAHHCTPGDFDCPTGGTANTDIRMTAADAQYAAQWEQNSGFTLDMVFNAGAGEEWKSEHGGTDAMAAQLLADKAKFRWVNHTYTHLFLGCIQDTTTVPWSCKKNADGSTQWTTRAAISGEISNNYKWAVQKGLPIDRSELVTGEHSGLKVLPQQPVDNPNLAGALADNGVKWTGSDSSREPDQRAVGAAMTVPRHPMNVYYNVGKAAEMTDEYNWLYTSKANGGSGVCENNPSSTCMPAPLNTATGYQSYIVPREAKTALSHVLWNDPRPHYAHQSNLAEERILYPVLDKVLGDYKALYAASAPIVNLREKDAGTEFSRRASWDKALAAGSVTAYRIGNTVTVQGPRGVAAPITAPEGTRKQLFVGTTVFGTAYAGARSDWSSPELFQSAITLKLPA
ncbi:MULTISPECIES: hypothetical protein [unclassified Streptomyces]|uniref:hypothetical protein n=1 Tax=unclassified Streptomyces TaxID=2593676 RepID=UPI00383044C2